MKAALMLIIKDGKILSVSRKKNKSIFGLPGGKQEKGETSEQAAIRECKEECGIDVSSCVYFFNLLRRSPLPLGRGNSRNTILIC